jgi:hypothetical protein
VDAQAIRAAAARRLALAEAKYRTAQAMLLADDSNEHREQYRLAIQELKAAEQQAQATLNGWRDVGEA